MIADNIQDQRLFYHREDGVIGQKDLKKDTILWEKSYFKQKKCAFWKTEHCNIKSKQFESAVR